MTGNGHRPRVGEESQEDDHGVLAQAGSRELDLDRHHPGIHVSCTY